MWALLPLKQFHLAKQRLANVLTTTERIGLFTAMVSDVLTTLTRHPRIDNTLIISNDPRAHQLAEDFAVPIMPEVAPVRGSLNAAVEAGVKRLSHWGIDDVLVAHGDLPLMTRSDLTRLIEISCDSASRPGLTIATDNHRRGSNVVVCSAAANMDYCYGRNSLHAHIRVASHKGFQVQVLTLPSIAHDIDTLDDLRFLHQHASPTLGRHSYQYLRSLGLGDRLDDRDDDDTRFSRHDYHLVS